MAMNIDESRRLLEAADVFFGPDEDDPGGNWDRMLNLNDAFYWACADGEVVEDDEMPRLAELFYNYGWPGICYWVVVEKWEQESVEFADVNRFIEFVRHEEQIRKETPDSNTRAYLKCRYTVPA